MEIGIGRHEDICLALVSIVQGWWHVELSPSVAQVALRGNIQVATWVVQLGYARYVAENKNKNADLTC